MSPLFFPVPLKALATKDAREEKNKKWTQWQLRAAKQGKVLWGSGPRLVSPGMSLGGKEGGGGGGMYSDSQLCPHTMRWGWWWDDMGSQAV